MVKMIAQLLLTYVRFCKSRLCRLRVRNEPQQTASRWGSSVTHNLHFATPTYVNGAKSKNRTAILLGGLIAALLLITTTISMKVWANDKTPQVNVTLSANQVWQRQQVILTLEVKTQDPFARLESGLFKQESFSITPLSTSEKKDDSKDKKQHKETNTPPYTLTKKWAIHPFISGTHPLKLPRIRYRPNRGRIITLDIPNPTLKVRALPLYIPPTMPIGKISLSHISLSDKQSKGLANIITPNNLYQWTITVTGKGVARQNMPPVSRQLVSTDSYEIFPAQRSQKTIETEQGVTQVIQYDIPIKATKSGIPSLPTIEVQYFDTTTGKLSTTQLDPPFLMALNKYLQWLIALVIIAILITLLIVASQKIKKRLKQILNYRQALQSLEKASTYEQVRIALNEIAQVKKWGKQPNSG